VNGVNQSSTSSFVAAFFFKAGIGVPPPAILLVSVGTGRHATRAPHGDAQTVEQLAHMAWMLMNAEFLVDDPGDHGRGPDARIQTIGYRAAAENVVELFPRRRRQFQWPANYARLYI
jgi:hypothetical protein